MKRIENNSALETILNDEELRRVYYEQSQTSKRERSQRRDQAEQDQRVYMQRFYRRSNYTPPEFRPAVDLLTMTAVEAWIFEHPLDDSANAATVSEMRRLNATNSLRVKAVRARLREIGIR